MPNEIRKALIEDTDQILELIKEFYEESLREYGISIDAETLKGTVKNFIENHIGLVAEKEGKVVGVISGLVSKSIFDSNRLVAQEVIWYVSKKYRKGTVGIKLMREFWKSCQGLGADNIIMGSMGNLMNDVLNTFYEKKGYKLMESHYIKEAE